MFWNSSLENKLETLWTQITYYRFKTMSCPNYNAKNSRSSKLPLKNFKYFAKKEKNVIPTPRHFVDSTFDGQRRRLIERFCFKFWRVLSFPTFWAFLILFRFEFRRLSRIIRTDAFYIWRLESQVWFSGPILQKNQLNVK